MFEGKQIIDITPEINESMAVFPGDRPFKRSVALDMNKGDNLTLSSISTSLHLGAHADSTNHYSVRGVGISERPLSYYMGACQVITVDKKNQRIKPEDILNIEIKAPRVLFKTNSFPDPYNWNSDFSSLSPELIEYLDKKNVILVGIDTPSVDPQDSKELESHNQIFKSDMAILEGIVLNEVSDALYELVALPLKIKGADASPVRAILLR